jgi:DNA-binding response OmpR family regulator
MKKNILLIDDDKLYLETVQEILRSDGYKVTCCDHGAQVAALLSKESFGAAVVDYHLPDMNGAKITSLLRKQSPHLLIIGFSLDHKEKEFTEAGADAFYSKPHINEVMSRINELR